VELFEQLRREYEFGIGTIKAVARKFGVHRRLGDHQKPRGMGRSLRRWRWIGQRLFVTSRGPEPTAAEAQAWDIPHDF
jgi:hypothetical protein